MLRNEQAPLHAAFVGHERFFDRNSVYIRWYPKTLTAPPATTAFRAESPRPRGVYIHVPFCDRLCRFCPFNKRVSDPSLVSRYVDTLMVEIGLYSSITGRSDLNYVYFGGGTPSVLSAHQVAAILRKLGDSFGLSSDVEVTLESHPTHITRQFLSDMSGVGVTRFSTGIQAFDDAMLARLGAQHGADDVERALKAAELVGAPIAIDLLFRCEGQDLQHWRRQLHRVGGPIAHVSCYSLILKDEMRQPSIETEAEMTLAIAEALHAKGFSHYASCASGGFDYALPGRQCRYGVRHWQAPQDEYLGIGPGALGYLANRTTVNGLELPRYFDQLSKGRLPWVSATKATPDEAQRRYFVLGVKTLKVPLGPFAEQFGVSADSRFREEFDRLEAWGFVRLHDNCLELTELGKLFVDTISAEFFSPSERDVPHPEEPEIRRMEVQQKRYVH